MSEPKKTVEYAVEWKTAYGGQWHRAMSRKPTEQEMRELAEWLFPPGKQKTETRIVEIVSTERVLP